MQVQVEAKGPPTCSHSAFLSTSEPQKYSNYLDEDFIFKTKKVAEKAHPLYMPTHVMMRYSIHACLRWWDGPF